MYCFIYLGFIGEWEDEDRALLIINRFIYFTIGNMQPKQPLSQKEGRHSPVHQRPPQISIGYYNLRGKAQVPRLLLEYLKVDYQDKLFTIQEWQKYASEHIEQFQFALLPYLKEGDFVVTDSVPICIYIINRFGHQDLLGRNLKDRAIVDMYIWTIPYMDNVITINCQQKSQQQLMKFKMQQWKANVCPRLIKIEQAASEQGWFLGYLTLIDFSIYELVRYMQNIFDMVHQDLPKLKRIQKEVGGLKQIKDYEASTRAITEWCPTKLLENMKSLMNKTENRSENQEKVNRKTEKEKNEK